MASSFTYNKVKNCAIIKNIHTEKSKIKEVWEIFVTLLKKEYKQVNMI